MKTGCSMISHRNDRLPANSTVASIASRSFYQDIPVKRMVTWLLKEGWTFRGIGRVSNTGWKMLWNYSKGKSGVKHVNAEIYNRIRAVYEAAKEEKRKERA